MSEMQTAGGSITRQGDGFLRGFFVHELLHLLERHRSWMRAVFGSRPAALKGSSA